MDKITILDNFIQNFIQKDKRERYGFSLKNDKKRIKFTERLNHKWETVLDMRFVTKIPSGVIDYEFVKNELKIRDIELCQIISDHGEIDGNICEFKIAFEKVYGLGFGSIIIAGIGDKIFLETELSQGKQNRFIGKLM